MNRNISPEVDPALTREIEDAAVAMAWGAGGILSGYFAGELSQELSIEYKDKNQQDPVTSADKATQAYLVEEIARRFPDHGILGEEDSPEGDTDAPALDFLWVLDPLDGTTNFLNGLPVYASSIGVMYRGWPLVGAMYLPWPNPKGGFVLHCRRGGGCFADGKPVSVFQAEDPAQQPVANRLIGLPGYFAQSTKFSKQIKGSPGELRTTGSIAYELGMTACGVLQYAVIGAPKLWDMLAGVLAVQEAGGTVMIRLPGEKRRSPMGSLVPHWEERPPSLKQLRRWVAPLVAGNRQLADNVFNTLFETFEQSGMLN
ncbi:MAG: inositol monophosphatase [Chloroflexi bacterium]|nr:inositol monophosphatase [Chloroflexota bacterium]